MEVCRGSACKRSSDSGLGVKGQSNLVIAGSYRNGPQSSLEGGRKSGRATDLGFWGGNSSVSRPTPNAFAPKNSGNGDTGVSLYC